VAKVLHAKNEDVEAEWKILKHFPADDLSHQSFLAKLSTDRSMKALFPVFSKLASTIVLLPVGTANVERSFSSLNRILCSERSRLTPDHFDRYSNSMLSKKAKSNQF
jgi:hypothetical protein